MTFGMVLLSRLVACDEVLRLWPGGSIVSSLMVYPYHQTIYQILPLVPTCLMILSTVYAGVSLPCMACLSLVVYNLHSADRGLALWSFVFCWRVRLLLVGTRAFVYGFLVAESVETTFSMPCLSKTSK